MDRRDATLIASAPNRLDRMERALRAVLAEHEPIDVAPEDGGTACDFCGCVYPCSTVAAIEEALSDE